MQVSDIMSRRVVTIAWDDPLWRVQEIFERNRFHHLLVVEADRLVGVLSDRDLLKALSPNLGTLSETPADAATLQKKVHQVASHKPIVLPPDATIPDAIALFNSYSISCIPIVDGEFRPVGVLSWRDILRSLGGGPLQA